MKWKKLLSSKISIFLLILLLIFGLRVEWKQWQERSSIQKEIDALIAQQNAIEQKNKSLEESLKILNTENYKERIARQQLNMKKDGELVVNFPESLPAPEDSTAGTVANSTPNWELWWNYFFN
jgi:cell division protein FtsB